MIAAFRSQNVCSRGVYFLFGRYKGTGGGYAFAGANAPTLGAIATLCRDGLSRLPFPAAPGRHAGPFSEKLVEAGLALETRVPSYFGDIPAGGF